MLVFNGADGAILIAGEVPPVVGGDAVAVGVGAGADGGVAGRGLGVGVVVVAVGEVRAMLEEEIEAAIFEVGAVAVEVVAAELIDDEDDGEFGVVVVSAGGRGDDGCLWRERRRGAPWLRLGWIARRRGFGRERREWGGGVARRRAGRCVGLITVSSKVAKGGGSQVAGRRAAVGW